MTLWVSPKLDLLTLPDDTPGDTYLCFYRLTPPVFAWLKRRITRATAAVATGKVRKDFLDGISNAWERVRRAAKQSLDPEAVKALLLATDDPVLPELAMTTADFEEIQHVAARCQSRISWDRKTTVEKEAAIRLCCVEAERKRLSYSKR
jgi:hypothetical protein